MRIDSHANLMKSLCAFEKKRLREFVGKSVWDSFSSTIQPKEKQMKSPTLEEATRALDQQVKKGIWDPFPPTIQPKEKQMKSEEAGMKLPTIEEATRTLSRLDNEIKKAECLVFPGTTTTVCCLTMKNGFHIVGMSDCVDPKDYDKEVGMKWAIQHAREQAKKYVAYLQKEEMHRGFRKRRCTVERENRGVEGTSFP